MRYSSGSRVLRQDVLFWVLMAYFPQTRIFLGEIHQYNFHVLLDAFIEQNFKKNLRANLEL